MSRITHFEQFMPVEKSKFLAALQSAGVDAARFEVSKMEISPPLMPGIRLNYSIARRYGSKEPE